MHERLEALEIQCAWQQDLLENLDATVARLNEELALQQAQLRALWGRLDTLKGHEFNLAGGAEIPPHY